MKQLAIVLVLVSYKGRRDTYTNRTDQKRVILFALDATRIWPSDATPESPRDATHISFIKRLVISHLHNSVLEPARIPPPTTKSQMSSAPTTPHSLSATLTPFDPASSRVMSTVASSPPDTSIAGDDDDDQGKDDEEDEEKQGDDGNGDDANDADYEVPVDDDVMVSFWFRS